jgi:hypothetical protein
MLKETRVAHIAPEHLGPWPLRAKAMSFSIITPTVMRVACMVLGACPFTPPASLTMRRGLGVTTQVAWSEMG